MIAKTIVLAEPAASSAGHSASDIVAICSLVVALLALGFSIAFAEVQRRHNIRVARPHMDIELGVISYVLRVTNHGPGVARLVAFSATTEGRTFNLLDPSEFYEFCDWLMDDPIEQISIERNALAVGSYIAPGLSVDTINLTKKLGAADTIRIDEKTNSIEFNISVSSLYDKIYTDYHAPIRAPK
nr:hypothetical protein [Stenotrophomonas pavanii]